jgi:hypothetical protein
MFIAPFSPDPLALAVGAAVPWVILQIIARPGMPASVAYLFIWQWLQTFTRVLQSMVDNESMGAGLYGPNVARAYWYMLASLVVMALAIRMVLGNLKPPTAQDRRAHFEWRPIDLFSLYVGMLFLAVGCRFAAAFVPALDQPLDAVSRLKIVVLFMLFTTVMTTGRSSNLLWGAVVLETVLGFTGLLSDFRGVFIYLAMAALASRVPLKGTTVAAGLGCAGFLIFLALFWTSVKAEYREFATGSSDSQNVKVALDARFGYLGNRLISPDAIDWNLASYALLARLRLYRHLRLGDRRAGDGARAGLRAPVAGRRRARAQAALPVSRQGGAVGYRSLCPAGARRFFGADEARHVDQRRLHGGEFRRPRLPRHAWRPVRDRPVVRPGHPLLHGAQGALDPARGGRPGIRDGRVAQRRGDVAAQDLRRHGDVRPRLHAAGAVRLSPALNWLKGRAAIGHPQLS